MTFVDGIIIWMRNDILWRAVHLGYHVLPTYPLNLSCVILLSSGIVIQHQGETQALFSKCYNKVSRDAKQSHCLFRDRKKTEVERSSGTQVGAEDFRSRIERYSQLNIQNIRLKVRIHKWQMRTTCTCLCGLDYLIEHNFSHLCPSTWKLHFLFTIKWKRSSHCHQLYTQWWCHQAPMVVPNPWSYRLLWFNTTNHKWKEVCKETDGGR